MSPFVHCGRNRRAINAAGFYVNPPATVVGQHDSRSGCITHRGLRRSSTGPMSTLCPAQSWYVTDGAGTVSNVRAGVLHAARPFRVNIIVDMRQSGRTSQSFADQSAFNAAWACLHAHGDDVRLEQSRPRTCVLRNPGALRGMYLGCASAVLKYAREGSHRAQPTRDLPACPGTPGHARCLVRAFGGHAGSHGVSILTANFVL